MIVFACILAYLVVGVLLARLASTYLDVDDVFLAGFLALFWPVSALPLGLVYGLGALAQLGMRE